MTGQPIEVVISNLIARLCFTVTSLGISYYGLSLIKLCSLAVTAGYNVTVFRKDVICLYHLDSSDLCSIFSFPFSNTSMSFQADISV
jgi:hypothetical protein